MKATAQAGSNIALVKYWGSLDPELHLPLNNSLSLTLDQAEELSQTLLAWTRIAREQREKGKEPAKGGA